MIESQCQFKKKYKHASYLQAGWRNRHLVETQPLENLCVKSNA